MPMNTSVLCVTVTLNGQKRRQPGRHFGRLPTYRNTEGNHRKANIKVVSSNKQWAKAKVITEVRLSDGTLDVNWNDIELTNTDQGWKIYIVKPYVPEFNSGIILNNETDNLKAF